MNQIKYEINGLKRPGYSPIEKKILYLNKIPFIRNLLFVKKMIYELYKVPLSTSISKDFYLSAPNLIVGKSVGLADTFILAYASVKIGNNCSFSFRNMIITSTHDVNKFSTIIAKPITIGNNVWVTTNVTILPGVTIGDNTIIGAGSVVTQDIPSGVIAAGNPCKVIKEIKFNK
jgi:maltose O-acetyltransferase